MYYQDSILHHQRGEIELWKQKHTSCQQSLDTCYVVAGQIYKEANGLKRGLVKEQSKTKRLGMYLKVSIGMNALLLGLLFL